MATSVECAAKHAKQARYTRLSPAYHHHSHMQVGAVCSEKPAQQPASGAGSLCTRAGYVESPRDGHCVFCPLLYDTVLNDEVSPLCVCVSCVCVYVLCVLCLCLFVSVCMSACLYVYMSVYVTNYRCEW
jgi:hypothetical protein